MAGRLTKGEDFQRVREQGKRWRGKFCALNAAQAQATNSSNTPQTRIGYIASKSIGNAIKRNRARRLMREAARHLKDKIPDGWDIVLIAHSSIIDEKARMQHVRDDLLWLFNKANIRVNTFTPVSTKASTPSPATTAPKPVARNTASSSSC